MMNCEKDTCVRVNIFADCDGDESREMNMRRCPNSCVELNIFADCNNKKCHDFCCDK